MAIHDVQHLRPNERAHQAADSGDPDQDERSDFTRWHCEILQRRSVIPRETKLPRRPNFAHISGSPEQGYRKSATLLGDWIAPRAEITAGEEALRGLRLLGTRYKPWMQLILFFSRLRRRGDVIFAIRPP